MHGCSSQFLNGLAQYDPDCTLLNDSLVLKSSMVIENNGYVTTYRLSNKNEGVDDFNVFEQSEGSLNALETSIRSHVPTTYKVKASDDNEFRFLNFLSIFLTTVSMKFSTLFCFVLNHINS